MSQQQVKKFISDLNDNEELQQKFKDALDIDGDEKIDSNDRVHEIVKQTTAFATDMGYEFTADEYRGVLVSKHVEDKGELSEDELEEVAGGGTAEDIGIITLSAVTMTFGCRLMN